MDTFFYCLVLGGASLIMLLGGMRLMRKYPRPHWTFNKGARPVADINSTIATELARDEVVDRKTLKS